MRITDKFLEAKVARVNKALGFESVEWNTIGSVHLYGDASGWKLHLMMNEHGGVTSLTQSGTLREAAAAVQGMIVATRIARGERP